jgi:hypothetical protein
MITFLTCLSAANHVGSGAPVLKDILTEYRQQIIGDWFRLIVETYPANSADFLTNQKDQFANPVGSTISREIEILFDELAGSMDQARISSAVDSLMRIRSIQDYTASQAAGVLFRVKDCVRALLADRMADSGLALELLGFESKVDIVALSAFDAYTRCRESLDELRLKEMMARSAKLTERVAKAGGVDFNDV